MNDEIDNTHPQTGILGPIQASRLNIRSLYAYSKSAEKEADTNSNDASQTL